MRKTSDIYYHDWMNMFQCNKCSEVFYNDEEFEMCTKCAAIGSCDNIIARPIDEDVCSLIFGLIPILMNRYEYYETKNKDGTITQTKKVEDFYRVDVI